MRIILAAIHSPSTAARSVYWALRENGHDVTTVGPMQHGMGWGEGRNYECYEWQPHIELRARADEPLKYEPMRSNSIIQSPDLVLQMERLMVGAFPCPNVLWALDNHTGEYGYAEDFSHIFIGHSWGHLSDNPKAKWLPAAYDPRYNYIIDPQAERPIDVLLIGNPYPHRVEFVKQLRARGVNVTFLSGPIWGEYNALYNQAKIALVVSKCGDLSGRVFEHFAAGCMVLTDYLRDAFAAGLMGQHDYISYESDDKAGLAAHFIKDFLSHPKDIAGIAAAGHEAGKRHTYAARIDEMLRKLD